MIKGRFVWILLVIFLYFTSYGVDSKSVSSSFKRRAFVRIRGKFDQLLRNASEIYDAGYKEIEADKVGELESERRETKDENQVRLVHEKQESKNETRKLNNDKQKDKINGNKKMDEEKSNYEQDERENADEEKQEKEENGTGVQNHGKQDDNESRSQKLKHLKDDDKANREEFDENLNLQSDRRDREKRIVCKRQKVKIWKQGKKDNGTNQIHGEKSGLKEKREKQYRGTKHSLMQNTNTLPAQCTPIHNNDRLNVFSCMKNAMQDDKMKELRDKCLGLGWTATVNIDPSSQITLQEVLLCLRNFQLLYKDNNAVEFLIPVNGKIIKLKLKNEDNGRFSAKHVYETRGDMEMEGQGNQKKEVDIFNLKPFVAGLDNDLVKSTIGTKVIELLKLPMNTVSSPNNPLKNYLKATFQNEANSILDDVFREMFVFTAACFLRKTGHEYGNQWLNQLQSEFDEMIKEVERNTKVKYELTANMLTTSADVKAYWQQLKNVGIISETFEGPGWLTKVQFSEFNPISLKCAFKLLQYFLYISPGRDCNDKADIEIPIGKFNAVFQLSRAPKGTNQILVNTKRKGAGKYMDFVDKELSLFPNQKGLAEALLAALESPLNKQPDFNTLLEVQEHGVRNDLKTALMYETAVEFLAVTMIAEAAQPSDYFKELYLRELSGLIHKNKRFPENEEMPSLDDIEFAKDKYLKEGRTPVVDQRTIQLLREMYNTGENIVNEFAFENFPARGKRKISGKKVKEEGGTQYAREDAHDNGERTLPGYAVRFVGTNQICE